MHAQKSCQAEHISKHDVFVVCQEMEVAQTGKGVEEEDGPVFDVTKFQLDYLTTPSGLLDIGIDLTKVDISTRTRKTDELYIIAYPHFNVNGESAERKKALCATMASTST